MDESRLERALREGPQFATSYVPRPLVIDALVLRPAVTRGRLVLILAVTGILLVLVLAGLAAAGFIVRDVTSYAIVIEQATYSDEQIPALEISHLVFKPGSDDPQPLDGFPAGATSLRWSADGRRVVYFVQGSVADSREQGEVADLFIADGDGANPVRVKLPRPATDYALPSWSPTARLVALVFHPGSCTIERPGENRVCDPAGGIDVFDSSGRWVVTIRSGDTLGTPPLWSPDSTRIGWHTGTCSESGCLIDTFHVQAIDDPGSVITLSLGISGRVAWSPEDRLLVVTHDNQFGRTDRVFTAAPDGTDVTEVEWRRSRVWNSVEWSANGQYLAMGQNPSNPLVIHDVRTGVETTLVYPRFQMSLVTWSPDAKHLVMAGPEGYYVLNGDGSGLPALLGQAQDVTWMPIR